MNEKVVVFGGAGFLGSHVADALSDAGYEVIIFDRKKAEYAQKNQTVITGDVLDRTLVERAVEGATYVYNFSGIADLDACKKDPHKTIETNVLGHIAILDSVKKCSSVKRVLFASSVYVYSQHGSFYRISKQTCEQLLEEYEKQYGTSYTILRYGSLYGKRAQEWNGVYNYIKQAVSSGVIKYPGSGEEKREYINVSDAARLSVDALKNEFKNECITITGSTVLNSKELLMMINEIMGKKLSIHFAEDNIPGRYVITPYSFSPKLGKKLIANPSVDIGQGLVDIIQEVFQNAYGDVAGQLKIEDGSSINEKQYYS
jgi:UDP-glucose 4-epimerase